MEYTVHIGISCNSFCFFVYWNWSKICTFQIHNKFIFLRFTLLLHPGGIKRENFLQPWCNKGNYFSATCFVYIFSAFLYFYLTTLRCKFKTFLNVCRFYYIINWIVFKLINVNMQCVLLPARDKASLLTTVRNI